MTAMPGMLGMLMGGGALPPLGDLIKLPCALCLALDVEPADAVTLAGGSLVCREHVRDALDPDVCHDLDAGARPREVKACAMFEGYHAAHGWTDYDTGTDYLCHGSSPAPVTDADPRQLAP